MSGHYKVKWLCAALLVSRSGYYDWLRRRRDPGPRARANLALRQRLRDEFERSRRTYGSPRIARVLGQPGSHNRVARLMRQEHLSARRRSKYRPCTTDSRHRDPIAPNRLRQITVQAPNQVWATDATCVLTGEGWFYVVALLDVYTRRIVGWRCTRTSMLISLCGRCTWRLRSVIPRPISSSTPTAAPSSPALPTGQSWPNTSCLPR